MTGRLTIPYRGGNLSVVNITTRARYSLRALIDIARHQESGPVRAADIAQRQQMSKGYLERILSHLVDAGLVDSRKGPGGGFLLARPAVDISAREVFAASGEELLTAPCMCDSCERDCPLYGNCPAREVWSGLRDAADAYLAQRNLAEFVSAGFRTGDKTQNGLRPLWSSGGSHRAGGPTVSCPESS